MIPVAKVTDLAPYVMGFSGKDVSASIKLPEEWAARHKFTLSNYYIQLHGGGKNIIVGYIREESSAASD